MIFRDRIDAGQRLAVALDTLRGEECVVFALPRGGLPVAYEVARRLKAPLDILLVRKIGAPFQPELALGAVVDGEKPEIVLNEDIAAALQPSREMLDAAVVREIKEIERRRHVYLCGHKPESARGKTAIIIDDGLATGATARAAVRALRRQDPKKLVLAVPVAPRDTAESLRGEVDQLVCLDIRDDFGAVGMYYVEFPQVTDQEVVSVLAQWRNERAKDG